MIDPENSQIVKINTNWQSLNGHSRGCVKKTNSRRLPGEISIKWKAEKLRKSDGGKRLENAWDVLGLRKGKAVVGSRTARG
jgi:hypothetical protein